MTLVDRLKEIPGYHSEAAYEAIARIEALEAITGVRPAAWRSNALAAERRFPDP